MFQVVGVVLLRQLWERWIFKVVFNVRIGKFGNT